MRARALARLLKTTVIAFISLAMFACGRARPGPNTPASGPQSGILRFAEIDEPDGLNPLIASEPNALEFSYFLYSFFFEVNDKSELVPDVALQVPTIANGGISKDGRTITYHLRRNVRWEDGAPLTARDVVFTYQAIMNPRNNIQGRFGYDKIAGVEAPDAYTVVVHMRTVDSAIVTLFMCLDGDYPILPAHLLAKYPDINHVAFNDKPVGSGPYRVAEWVRGDHLTLDANLSYWRGPPGLDKIEIFFVRDGNEIIDRLRAGTVDAWFRADPTAYPSLSQIPDIRVAISPDNNFGHLDFNLHDPLLQDVRVRKAIEMAIDRRRIVRDVTSYVYQTTDSDQPFTSWAYARSVPHVSYDRKGATALLQSAGWRRGADGVLENGSGRLSLQLAYLKGSVLDQQIADILKSELAAVGIELIETPLASDTFLASKQAGGKVYNGKYQLAMFSWGVGIDPDDSWLYACNQQPPAGENSMFWCDPNVDAAEADALGTFDVRRRASDYAIIQNEIADQVPMVFLYAQRRADAYSTHFSGFAPAPTFAYWDSYRWQMF